MYKTYNFIKRTVETYKEWDTYIKVLPLYYGGGLTSLVNMPVMFNEEIMQQTCNTLKEIFNLPNVVLKDDFKNAVFSRSNHNYHAISELIVMQNNSYNQKAKDFLLNSLYSLTCVMYVNHIIIDILYDENKNILEYRVKIHGNFVDSGFDSTYPGYAGRIAEIFRADVIDNFLIHDIC